MNILNIICKFINPNIFQKIEDLEKTNKTLKSELIAKGNIFFKDQKWLGVSMSAYGTVVDGKLIIFERTYK